MKKTFFSSDWHLGHKNIITYDKRPFDSVEEMNNTIIKNYNSVVGPDDDFFYLGDFCFDRHRAEEFLSQLQGNLYFIRGNHDNHDMIKAYRKFGYYFGDFAEVKVNGQSITLCHYAMKVWNKSHRGTWHLYGHSHHSLPDDPHSLSFDIGVNGHNYYPLEFSQVEKIMSKKSWKPIDHHGDRE